jgi:hypothetical protein
MATDSPSTTTATLHNNNPLNITHLRKAALAFTRHGQGWWQALVGTRTARLVLWTERLFWHGMKTARPCHAETAAAEGGMADESGSSGAGMTAGTGAEATAARGTGVDETRGQSDAWNYGAVASEAEKGGRWGRSGKPEIHEGRSAGIGTMTAGGVAAATGPAGNAQGMAVREAVTIGMHVTTTEIRDAAATTIGRKEEADGRRAGTMRGGDAGTKGVVSCVAVAFEPVWMVPKTPIMKWSFGDFKICSRKPLLWPIEKRVHDIYRAGHGSARARCILACCVQAPAALIQHYAIIDYNLIPYY